MRKVTTEQDKSRMGTLVHAASSSGREVHVVAYIEGVEPDARHEIDSRILCRTQEQAAEVARVLREALAPGFEKLTPKRQEKP